MRIKRGIHKELRKEVAEPFATIDPPTTTQAMLKSPGLPTRAPPQTPVRSVPPDWSPAQPSANRHGAKRADRAAA
jgi:hypothetical protein